MTDTIGASPNTSARADITCGQMGRSLVVKYLRACSGMLHNPPAATIEHPATIRNGNELPRICPAAGAWRHVPRSRSWP